MWTSVFLLTAAGIAGGLSCAPFDWQRIDFSLRELDAEYLIDALKQLNIAVLLLPPLNFGGNLSR